MQQLGRQAVAHVDHSCGGDARFGKSGHNVAAGFRLKLAFYKIFLA